MPKGSPTRPTLPGRCSNPPHTPHPPSSTTRPGNGITIPPGVERPSAILRVRRDVRDITRMTTGTPPTASTSRLANRASFRIGSRAVTNSVTPDTAGATSSSTSAKSDEKSPGIPGDFFRRSNLCGGIPSLSRRRRHVRTSEGGNRIRYGPAAGNGGRRARSIPGKTRRASRTGRRPLP